MGPMRKALASIAVASVGIVAALIVAEIALRLAGLAEPRLYEWNPARGWALVPGANRTESREGNAVVKINRDGFRGPDRSLAHPSNTYRVAVLGDSFTEAQQVDYADTFCAVLERELAACPILKGRAIEVLDFGIDSYGTAQELLTLREQAQRFSPDAVVLAFFPGNDVRNNSVELEGDKCRPFFVERSGELVPGGPFLNSSRFRFDCMMRFESRRFAVLNLIGGIHGLVMAYRRRSIRSSHLAPASEPHEEIGLDSVVYLPPPSSVWNDAWRVTEGEIEMMHDDAQRNHEQFFVVSLSTPMQDQPDAALRDRFQKRLAVADLFYPGRRLKALGDRDGFPVLDLAPITQAYAQQHHAYLHGFANTHLGEGHWNAEGHRVAGEAIARWMCEVLAGAHHQVSMQGRFLP
jgi:hypothetical protein